jgi:hypothetical protein
MIKEQLVLSFGVHERRSTDLKTTRKSNDCSSNLMQDSLHTLEPFEKSKWLVLVMGSVILAWFH